MYSKWIIHCLFTEFEDTKAWLRYLIRGFHKQDEINNIGIRDNIKTKKFSNQLLPLVRIEAGTSDSKSHTLLSELT